MVTKTENSDFVLIDGPNIEGVLKEVLGRWPEPHERPRWDTAKDALSSFASVKSRPKFFFNKVKVTDRHFPLFRALRSFGYEVLPVYKTGQYPPNNDPVDEAILVHLAEALSLARIGKSVDVTVIAHDHIYSHFLSEILKSHGKVTVVGLREELSPHLLNLERMGAQILDLQYDLYAFQTKIPRLYSPNIEFNFN